MSIIPEVLEASFNDLSINDFIVRVRFVADKQELHSAFQDCPEYVTRPDKLRQMADNLGVLRDASSGGDRQKREEKIAAWDATKLALSMNASHLIMLSLHRNDPSILLNAGYDPKQKGHSARTSTDLLVAPPELSLKHGSVSGALVIMVKRAKSTASYELQVNDHDPGDEASWSSLGIYSRARVELKNLEPAKRLYFRVRYHDAGGTSQWSRIVSIIVL